MDFTLHPYQIRTFGQIATCYVVLLRLNSIRMWCKTQILHPPILTIHVIILYIKENTHNHT